MKYLVLLTDGVADYPVPELNGKTPLQVAVKSNIDKLAALSEVGLVRTVPAGLPPGSDVANLAVMGYDPEKYYTGRSPLEAVSIGVELGPNDVAFRCNLVTLGNDETYEKQMMIDYSSDEITTEEAAAIIATVAEHFNTETIKFYAGTSYRHLMVWKNGFLDLKLTPPHDISDRPITDFLPQGPGAETLIKMMKESQQLLKDHPVNQKRISRGLRPATSVWFWGQGKKPQIDSFQQKYRINGAVISAVDLLKGLGICSGLRVINVPGATGNIHTNFKGKAEATIEAFKSGADFVYLHFEAPDEAGHRGEIDTKIKAIEIIDRDVVAYLLSELPKIDPEFKIMLLPDHPTPLVLKTHVSDPVPFLIYDSTNLQPNKLNGFDESSASSTGLVIEQGYRLMDRFIGGV